MPHHVKSTQKKTHSLKNLHTCAHTGTCTIKGKHIQGTHRGSSGTIGRYVAEWSIPEFMNGDIHTAPLERTSFDSLEEG